MFVEKMNMQQNRPNHKFLAWNHFTVY